MEGNMMKKRVLAYALALITAVGIVWIGTACDYYIKLNNSETAISRSFSGSGGSTTVTVTTNCSSWSCSCSESWIHVNSSDNSVTVTVSAYDTGSTRYGTVKFSGNGGGDTITNTLHISQSAKNSSDETTISVSKSDFEVSFKSQSDKFTVGTGTKDYIDYNATPAQSWLHVSKNGNTVTFTADKNSASRRTGTITIRVANTTAPPVRVTVTQHGWQEDAVNWAENKIGQKVGSGQCPALICAYYEEVFGVSSPGGDGKDYAENTLPTGWERIEYYQGFVAQPGDIAVWKKTPSEAGSQYGHVAIVGSADKTTMHVFDQGNSSGNKVRTTDVRYSASGWTFYGVIRPCA